jgi:hypothetical protein
MSRQSLYAAQAAYESSLATYEAFRLQHTDVLDEHDHLAVSLSESLEVLKNELRDNAATVGKKFSSFTISVPRIYDVEALRKSLGKKADPFVKTVESVDSKRFEEAVEKGLIDRSVEEAVVGSGTPRISGGPKPPSIFQR